MQNVRIKLTIAWLSSLKFHPIKLHLAKAVAMAVTGKREIWVKGERATVLTSPLFL